MSPESSIGQDGKHFPHPMFVVKASGLWNTLLCTFAALPFSAYITGEFMEPSPNSRWVWLAATVVCVVAGAYAAFAGHRWEKWQIGIAEAENERQRELAESEKQKELDSPWNLENFVEYLQTPVIQLAGETVACWIHCVPRVQLHQLRMDMMNAVANSVGRSGSPGTRANVFEFQTRNDGDVVLTNTEYFKGRGKRSVRTFRQVDPTFRDTLNNYPRFVENAGKDYEYETYMTMPIVAGPNDFYGALTVDAPKSGQLDGDKDLVVMRYWAALLALTYGLEGFRPVKGYCGEPDC